MGSLLRWAARWVAVIVVLLGIAACSATVVEVEPAEDQSGQGVADADLQNAAALTSQVEPSAETGLLAIEPLTAFMDACVADAVLVGPCHCAAARMESGLSTLDFVVFEDRMTGALEFSPELATALVDCREAAAPTAWSQTRQQRYLDECSAGADRLKSLCACSLERAQQVVAAHRLRDFLASSDVEPSIVDFLNDCV